MTELLTLTGDQWAARPEPAMQARAANALEHGKVLVFPGLSFSLAGAGRSVLDPAIVKPGTKSVKYSPGKDAAWGMNPALGDEARDAVTEVLKRYAACARALVDAYFPHYAAALETGNTSLRPVEAEGRIQSRRHDDRLLHVDAFPSRPNYGQRLLRVFCNINPHGKPRTWKIGEPFAQVAGHFLPKLPRYNPLAAKVLQFAHVTKTLRSEYDHMMLKLHDRMKLDDAYQAEALQERVQFAPGTTWVVFSDQVSHAALAGQHMLEQTFTLPVEAQAYPDASPIRVLEGLAGRKLA